MRQRLIFALVIFAAAVWIIALGWMDMDAKAGGDQDTRWATRRFCAYYAWDGSCGQWRYRRFRNHVYHLPEQHPSRVYAYERRDDDRVDRHRPQCVGRDVDVVSTEHTTEDHARDSATKLWMARTQWEWGSQYMALDNATHVRWRCSASNAHDTVTGRLAEGAAKLIGRDGQNSRCYLSARPCRAALDKDRRRER